jgi:hydroxypyruvate reductase
MDREGASLRKSALSIFAAVLEAADPGAAVRRHFKIPTGKFKNIYVVGAGKASAAMARALEQMLGRRIQAGFINVKDGHTARLRRIEQNECGHPVPDERGVAGARRIAEIARGAGAGDLLICLISGGASALMPLPAEPISLAQKQETTKLLLASGADIHEINAVRKHISRIKGGQLAKLAQPATVVSLILSDVIGDDLDVIGSGPTAPDATTFAQARDVLEKYGIFGRVPAAVRQRIEKGIDGLVTETPKAGDPVFAKTRNIIVGSNRQALAAAAARARKLGFHTLLLSSFVEGETREIARMHAAIAKEIRSSGQPVRPPACVITGGETTVTLRGPGKGGRNQEFALAAALDLAGLEGVLILSSGTDGTDGPTNAAGAMAGGTTIARAEKLGLSARQFLQANDSYNFFAKLDDLVITGPTNTNVMDIHVLLVETIRTRRRVKQSG